MAQRGLLPVPGVQLLGALQQAGQCDAWYAGRCD